MEGRQLCKEVPLVTLGDADSGGLFETESVLGAFSSKTEGIAVSIMHICVYKPQSEHCHPHSEAKLTKTLHPKPDAFIESLLQL